MLFHLPLTRKRQRCTNLDPCVGPHRRPWNHSSTGSKCCQYISNISCNIYSNIGSWTKKWLPTCGMRRLLCPHPLAWPVHLCRSWVQGSRRICWPASPHPLWIGAVVTLGTLELRFWRQLLSSSPKSLVAKFSSQNAHPQSTSGYLPSTKMGLANHPRENCITVLEACKFLLMTKLQPLKSPPHELGCLDPLVPPNGYSGWPQPWNSIVDFASFWTHLPPCTWLKSLW